ncbi:hypothetical protein [Pedobacter paludis]|uniref:Uncharacterized protein n=1 Tax=Pedobacter paludis TaxID=2203212 RepID=A0A317F3K6_9SPHI|nr:hypothetical protein [Pedobacter paludis]PWS32627.1 hypothetical protein DF947_06020 [Pedobacter paludis]
MKIAVLGWGSLIWDKRNLSIADGKWHENGPALPIEFARISSDGRLTLVIKPNWTDVVTLYAISLFDDIDHAVENLRAREGTVVENIGYYNFSNGEKRVREANESILPRLQSWAVEIGIDAVIWTDLSPNFSIRLKIPFNMENIKKYLNGVESGTFKIAKGYIDNAPKQVDTRFRRDIGEFLEESNKSRLPQSLSNR